MLDSFLNIASLRALLPYLTIASLIFCTLLWIIQAIRLYRRASWCIPRAWRYKQISNCKKDVNREMIRHENELMNHRLTWLMTAEGLLFTALGFALSKDNAAIAMHLIPILSFVGILLAASASIVLDAADAAIIRLSPMLPKYDNDADVIGFRGIPFVGLFAPWRIYPPMFIISWYLISQIRI